MVRGRALGEKGGANEYYLRGGKPRLAWLAGYPLRDEG